jgi:hypothetical protein
MSYFFWISTKILVVCQLAQRKVIEYTTVNISWNATQSVKLKATNKCKERNYLTKKVFFFLYRVWWNWYCGNVILYLTCCSCRWWRNSCVFTETVTDYKYKSMQKRTVKLSLLYSFLLLETNNYLRVDISNSHSCCQNE